MLPLFPSFSLRIILPLFFFSAAFQNDALPATPKMDDIVSTQNVDDIIKYASKKWLHAEKHLGKKRGPIPNWTTGPIQNWLSKAKKLSNSDLYHWSNSELA